MSRIESSLSDEFALQRLAGKRIRRQRLEQGLTLDTLAGLAGVSAAFLSRFETGHRAASLKTLLCLCSVLRLKVGDVLDVNEEPVATVVPAQESFVEHGVVGLSLQVLSQQRHRNLLMVNAVLQGGGRCVLRGAGPLTAVQVEGLSFLKHHEDAHILEAGDALTVIPRKTVTWVNQCRYPSRALWIGTSDVGRETLSFGTA